MPNTSSFKVAEKLFLVRQEAKKVNAPPKVVETPTNYVAVIDCSGSMFGELPKVREQLKKRLPKLLKEKDTFSLIWFSGRGQFGALLEGEPVATLTELKDVERAIDRWLQPQGLTGFKEPLEEVERLVGRVSKKSGGNPFALLFVSDGHDNCSNRGEILKAVEKAAGSVQSATFVEYGYYADRQLLTTMAEKAGGQLIHAQDFSAYAPTFESVIQKRPLGAPKVEVKVEGDAIRGFAWTQADGDLITYGVESGKINVPENTPAIWYLSPTSVGNTFNCATSFKDAADPNADNAGLEALPAAYAALSLFSTRMAPEVILPLLVVTGDVTFIDQFGGLFGRQKYSEFMDATKAAVFDPKLRLTKGYDPKKIPAEDAFTVLDLLRLLSSDDDNRVLLDHEKFKYSRIGRGRVDAASVLTDEEQAEVTKLIAELSGVKDVKKAKEINAKIAAITDNKPEPLKFETDPAPEGYSISNLTYNEEKPNVSMLIRRTGTVDISKVKGEHTSLPDKFPTFIYRNYAIIKDGLVNVEVLPVKLSKATLEALFKAHAEGKLPDDVVVGEGDVTILNLKSLPVINRKMVSKVSAKTLFEDEWALLGIQAQQKVYNAYLKEMGGGKKSATFVETYGQAAADWLKEQGFTDYSGFGPKQKVAESTDVYKARELAVAIKGYSAIPSLNEFKKKNAEKKLTPSATLMKSAYEAVTAFLETEAGKDPKKAEAWLTAKVKALDVERRSRIASKAQAVFCIIVGQTWPIEFASLDESTMDITVDGQKLSCSLNAREVDVKI